MILTVSEYAEAFTLNKKKVSVSTVKRRCAKNMLPNGHKPRKIPGARGVWVIEIVEVI